MDDAFAANVARLAAHGVDEVVARAVLQRFEGDGDVALDFLLDTDEGWQFAAETLLPKEVVEELAAQPSDVRSKLQKACATGFGRDNSALHLVVADSEGGASIRAAIVRCMVAKFADVDTASAHGDTPLLLAVRALSIGSGSCDDRLAVVSELLAHRADVNLADREGETPLMEAVCLDDVGCVRLLLSARADPLKQSAAGAVAVDFCSNPELTELLQADGAAESEKGPGPQFFRLDADEAFETPPVERGGHNPVPETPAPSPEMAPMQPAPARPIGRELESCLAGRPAADSETTAPAEPPPVPEVDQEAEAPDDRDGGLHAASDVQFVHMPVPWDPAADSKETAEADPNHEVGQAEVPDDSNSRLNAASAEVLQAAVALLADAVTAESFSQLLTRLAGTKADHEVDFAAVAGRLRQEGDVDGLLTKLVELPGAGAAAGSFVRELLAADGDPNARNFMEESLLLLASRAAASQDFHAEDRLATVRCLLQERANPNCQDSQGETPLMEAACAGDLELCKALVEAGADVVHESSSGASAVRFAEGYPEVSRFLRSRLPDLPRAVPANNTESEADMPPSPPQASPVPEESAPAAEFPPWLQGAEDRPSESPSPPSRQRHCRPAPALSLREAAAMQSPKAVSAALATLSSGGGDGLLNQTDADGYTALHLCLLSPPLSQERLACEAQEETVRLLLAARASPNCPGQKGEIPLQLAATLAFNCKQILRLLLQAKATVDGDATDEDAILSRLRAPKAKTKLPSSRSELKDADVLLRAAEAHDAKRVVELLESARDANIADLEDADGHRPLHRCLLAPPYEGRWSALSQTVKALLAARASPNAASRDAESPLLLAVRSLGGATGDEGQRLQILRQLLKASADSNQGDHQDTTPLMEAVRVGDAEVCQLLLDRGCAADRCGGARGLSAIDAAWQPGSAPAVRAVFEAQGLKPAGSREAQETNLDEAQSKVTLRHVTTLLERTVCVPVNACIRDVKKLIVRLTNRGSWRRVALLSECGRALCDSDGLGGRVLLLVADARSVEAQKAAEKLLPEEERWPKWSQEDLSMEAARRGIDLQPCGEAPTRDSLLACLLQVKKWESQPSAELRAEALRRGLPGESSPDRGELLELLLQDLCWEHMGQEALSEECRSQGIAQPEAQETTLLLRAMRSRLRQALRWSTLDMEKLREACEMRHMPTEGCTRSQLLDALKTFKVMPKPKPKPKPKPETRPPSRPTPPQRPSTASASSSSASGSAPMFDEDGSVQYPSWMTDRVRRLCTKYPNFSGQFLQEMEDWQDQDVEMYLYSNGFLKPGKKKARPRPAVPLSVHFAALGLEESASAGEVRKAYRRLALVYHPDKNPEDPEAAADTFRRLAEAYEALAAHFAGAEQTSSDVAG